MKKPKRSTLKWILRSSVQFPITIITLKLLKLVSKREKGFLRLFFFIYVENISMDSICEYYSRFSLLQYRNEGFSNKRAPANRKSRNIFTKQRFVGKLLLFEQFFFVVLFELVLHFLYNRADYNELFMPYNTSRF